MFTQTLSRGSRTWIIRVVLIPSNILIVSLLTPSGQIWDCIYLSGFLVFIITTLRHVIKLPFTLNTIHQICTSTLSPCGEFSARHLSKNMFLCLMPRLRVGGATVKCFSLIAKAEFLIDRCDGRTCQNSDIWTLTTPLISCCCQTTNPVAQMT